MLILALETSAKACSVALCEEERLVAQSYQNCGLTHSRTLMPQCEQLLACCGVGLPQVDMIAVAAGPGSFTGLRIGVAAAKGLAWPEDKPCAGVSTLEAMAWLVAHMGMDVCPVMDARRNQVYNACFSCEGEKPYRYTEDRAISIDELAAQLAERGREQLLIGDGAQLCFPRLAERGISVRLPPEHLRFQSAWGVARAGLEAARRGALVSASELVPSYHRLSQAERERLEKESKESEKGV